MRIGHIKIEVQQYADQRWGFDDYSSGQRKMVRLWSKKKAESRATDINVLVANRRVDLLQGTPAEWQEFLAWKAGASKHSLGIVDACTEFVKLKAHKSNRYQQSLERDLALFQQFVGPTKPIGAIMAIDIQHFLDSREVGQRRKFNLRVSVVSLFRWARRMSYLPDRTTEAEKVESIQKVPGKPNVLSPSEMQTLLANVREDYLPWLCVAAFAGIRTEEIAPDRKSKKSPLKWEDFDWQHKTLVVRAETAKTAHEREVPIPDNLAQWLAPHHSAKGPICVFQPTNNETGRLGAYIGGWKHNCLRDSFCSYRTRITQNVHQTSYEMGNSPAMVKRSYHQRQPVEMARAWFDIRPNESANVIAFA